MPVSSSRKEPSPLHEMVDARVFES